MNSLEKKSTINIVFSKTIMHSTIKQAMTITDSPTIKVHSIISFILS